MLALGIGATTAIFSISTRCFKPLPYADSDALVNIIHNVDGSDLAYFSDVIYLAYADNNRRSTASACGLAPPPSRGRHARGGARGDLSREVLPILGMQPALGRWFAQDDGAEADNSVILADD